MSLAFPKGMQNLSVTLSAFSLFAALGLSGCYTQLYTQGYASRTLDAPAGYSRSSSYGDTLAPGDSAVAEEGQRDTLVRPGTVVVNNYYRESPYYRGYLVDEWESPYIAFGFYSSRYRDYNGAYWWNDPGYHHYHERYYRSYRGSYPSAGGGNGAPSQHLFSTPNSSRHTGKSRSRSGSASAPAPKQAEGQSHNPPQPDSQVNPPSDNSSGNNQGSSNDNGSDDDHPHAQKGRRH